MVRHGLCAKPLGIGLEISTQAQDFKLTEFEQYSYLLGYYAKLDKDFYMSARLELGEREGVRLGGGLLAAFRNLRHVGKA